ncbi:hypothetical protein [Paenibacillus sp. BAC0078]
MKWGMPDMMRSRFFFNSGIIRQNVRQHGWIGIIYTLGLLFSLPLQLFMSSYPGAQPQKIENLFRVGGNIQILFIISLPVAAGLFLFRYLQSKMPSDLWHSLPLRREHLLAAHMASGIGLLLIPVWLTAGVTAIVTPLSGNMYIYPGADIWQWGLIVSILTLFLFVFSVFVGICTGQTVLQGIVIYILLILPAVLLQFVNQHFSTYLYGYPDWYVMSNRLESWSPLLRLMDFAVNPFSRGELWVYAALSAVFLALSFVLYRKRQSEKAGQAIAFTYFNPLFKAGVMLCAMLLSGTYFSSLKPNQLGWIICSHIVGALFGYIAAEMIIRKTWQIITRKTPLEFAVYGILLGLLVYIPVSRLTGYESRVPSADRISSVYAGSNYRMYNDNSYPLGSKIFSKDKSYIEAVRKLHQALVIARPEETQTSSGRYVSGSEKFTIFYQLENGRKLVREYMIPAQGFEPELKTVMENPDFKRREYNLQGLDKGIESFRLTSRNRAVSITEPEDVQEFKAILVKEILNMSYEDQTGGQLPRAYIQPVLPPEETKEGTMYYIHSYNWLPSYKELGNWLEQKGFADKVGTRPEDVKSAEMIKDDYKGKLPQEEVYNLEKHMSLSRSENRSVVTRDKARIAEILKYQRDYTGKNGAYVVRVEYKDGDINYISLQEQDMPPALKSLLP